MIHAETRIKTASQTADTGSRHPLPNGLAV